MGALVLCGVPPGSTFQQAPGDLRVTLSQTFVELKAPANVTLKLRVVGELRCGSAPGPAHLSASGTGFASQSPAPWVLRPNPLSPAAKQDTADPTLYRMDQEMDLYLVSEVSPAQDLWRNVSWLGSRSGTSGVCSYRWQVAKSDTLTIHVLPSAAETGAAGEPGSPDGSSTWQGQSHTPGQAWGALAVLVLLALIGVGVSVAQRRR
ncbi:MAG: hypothetical protein HYT80_00985 [Euryarchaeota archaeon]|nr:hypothetical protein [Euryarchaeota archaeon]